MRIATGGRLSRRRPWALVITLGLVSLTLPACQLLDQERVLYDHQGVHIGLQADPSLPRASRSTTNTHPQALTDEEIATLLGAVRVSGWSGTVVGLFDTPHAIPLFEEADLRLISRPIAEAFRQATPEQRVLFFIPNPRSPYGDATAGALFVRGSHLYVIVTDHKAFARADTAGGDEKDIRDTKGMRLSLASPSRMMSLPETDEPVWAPFETVHLALNMKEILAQGHPNRSGGRMAANISHEGAPTQTTPAVTDKAVEPAQELRLQIRELTQSNQDLRDRLAQQSQQLQNLKEELARLRRDSEGTKAKKPAIRKPSTP